MIIGQSGGTLNGVRFIAKSNLVHTTATSQNQTIPECDINDVLIAAVMHGDTLTPEVGWTLIDSATGTDTANSISQRTSLYYKIAGSGETGNSTTWAQATSKLIAVMISSFRTRSGQSSIIAHTPSHADDSSLATYPNPVATATADNQMGVVFSSLSLANGVTDDACTFTMTNGRPSTQLTDLLATPNRLIGGYGRLLNGTDTAGNVTDSAGGTPGAWASVATVIGQDPYWANTVLLTGFEGANGSTSVSDESFAQHGAAIASTGSISTAQSKFGTSSYLFSGGHSVRWANHSDFQLGTGNFTIECFFRLSSLVANNHSLMALFSSAVGNLSWILYVNTNGSAGKLFMNQSTTGSNNLNDLLGSSYSIAINTWYHACVDFDGSKYRLYQDGVMVGSSTTLRSFFASTAQFAIGSNSDNGGLWMNGYIDEPRITKVCRYGDDGGFTVPAAAYPRG